MTHAGAEVWRRWFTASTVSFPVWSPEQPDRLYFSSDENGSLQGWLLDLATSERRQLTDQKVGVETLVVTPDGSEAAWWSDDTGDEHGAWVVSQGLSMAGDVVAVGLADNRTYRIFVADARRQHRLPRGG